LCGKTHNTHFIPQKILDKEIIRILRFQ